MKKTTTVVGSRLFVGILALAFGVTMNPSGPVFMRGNDDHQIASGDLREEAIVEVTYALASDRFSLREPIVINFNITNRLGEPVRIDLGHNSEGAFKFTVTQPGGTKVTNAADMVGEGLSWPRNHTVAPKGTYRQSLVLNQWFDFSMPGKYEVAVELEAPISKRADGAAISNGAARFTFVLEPRNEARLEQICASLLTKISQSGVNYEAAREAAIALAYVNDPIAVKYLAQAIKVSPITYYVVIGGLRRIRGEEAARVLIEYMRSKENGTDWPLQAKFALQEVEKKTVDKALKREIKIALKEYSRANH